MCMSEHEGRRAMAASVRPNDYLVKPLSRESFADLPRLVRNWTLRLDLPDSFGPGEEEIERTSAPPKNALRAASRL
jgi:hypothetical protein